MTDKTHPKTGEKWCLKSNPKKIAEITSVEIDDEYEAWGYVGLKAPWLKRRHAGKPMDTFLKQYRKASDSPNTP